MNKIEGCDFLIVFPFYNGDADLMLKNIRYLRTLTQSTKHHCLLSIDKGTSDQMVEEIKQEAEGLFEVVHTFKYPSPEKNPWPIPQNESFQNTARYLEYVYKGSWFWYESDSVALRPEWIDMLYNEYREAKKPFMGHVVKGVVPGTGHMNGVGIYPWCMSRFTTNAFMCRSTAWDVAMASQMMGQCHAANHLIQHVWTENVQDTLTATSRDRS